MENGSRFRADISEYGCKHGLLGAVGVLTMSWRIAEVEVRGSAGRGISAGYDEMTVNVSMEIAHLLPLVRGSHLLRMRMMGLTS